MTTIQSLKPCATHDVVCVALDVHLWSARIQLRAEDLQKYSPHLKELPDNALASLGSVKLCDPEVVRKFERLKREAQLLLESTGLPLFGIRAVPSSKFDEVRVKLDDIKGRFKTEALNLLNSYDHIVGSWRNGWEQKNPGYGHLLDRIPKAEAVFGALSFDYHAYRVEPPKGTDDEAGSGDFTTKLTGLRGELYSDAAREAVKLLEESFVKDGAKREYITPKTLGPFKRIANRFRDFSFVDPSAIAAAELIESTVSQAISFAQSDKKNRISDGPLMLIWAMAHTFANPANAAALAEKSCNEGTLSAWDHLMNLGSHTAEIVVQQPTVALETVSEAAQRCDDDIVEVEEVIKGTETSFNPSTSLISMQQCITDANYLADELIDKKLSTVTEPAMSTQALMTKVTPQQVTGIDLLFAM